MIMAQFLPTSVLLALVCAACCGVLYTRLALARRKVLRAVGASRRLWIRTRYLWDGPRILSDSYAKARDAPFVVKTPSNDHVMVSSEKHINELSQASHEWLSLHAIAKEMLQPKFTMHGFEWREKRNIEGTGFVRALRSLLTSHLPRMLPEIEQSITSGLSHEIAKSQWVNGEFNVRVFPFVKELIVRVNCMMFFGSDISKNEEFRQAALQFPQDVIIAGEMLRITPEVLKPIVSYVATGGHWAVKTMRKILEPEVQRRLDVRVRASDGLQGCQKPVDCMQWLIDTSPRKPPWSCSRTIGEILAIWFGSVHQLAISATFLLYDLGDYAEYRAPLLHEVQRMRVQATNATNEVLLGKLELMDSFIMESARMSCFDAISGRRKALSEFTFSDGTKVSPGDWTCLPQIAMMRDARNFKNPNEFQGFRFASRSALDRCELSDARDGSNDTAGSSRMRYTDVRPRWLIWGIGNTACPGRFYSSLVLKLILIHVLEKYECRNLHPRDHRTLTWRSSIAPKGNIRMAFAPREL